MKVTYSVELLEATINKQVDRIEALEKALREADTACFMLCTNHGFATGHGDTVADMIGEIDAQISTRIEALEAALQEIAGVTAWTYSDVAAVSMQAIARAALAPEPEKS